MLQELTISAQLDDQPYDECDLVFSDVQAYHFNVYGILLHFLI
jgi:hypothetical protein